MKTVIDSTRAGKLNWREILNYTGLFRYLSLRDVLVRYKQTWAGLLWAIIRPLIQIVIFGFLNLIIQKNADYKNAFLFVSSGVIMWQLISTAITDISNSLVSNSNILTKVYFPKILLPASSLLVCLIDFAIAFVIFVVMFLILKGAPGWEILFLPLVLIYAIVFCFAVGMLFATMNVKYRDVKFVLPFILQIAFYISPVFLTTGFYLERNVPEILKDIYMLNPLVTILDGFRFCFFGGEAIHSVPLFLGSVGITLLLLIFSVRYFLRFEKTFADFI
ncbi:MAG: ABC transporter permease [Bacteroidetes bacterium]|nr:ABC transporter permease [Bacteroidota bacterium]